MSDRPLVLVSALTLSDGLPFTLSDGLGRGSGSGTVTSLSPSRPALTA